MATSSTSPSASEGGALGPAALSILNPTPARLPGPSLLHHLVTPPCDLQALEALEHVSHKRTRSYTYRDLHRAADAVAHLITAARRRPGPDLVVPVLVPQSPSLYISLLAILKAGAAFCPLGLDAPPDRIKFILDDVSADLVLVSDALASRIPPDSGVSVIRVDQPDPLSSNTSHDHPKPTPDDLAYVMYTSGSTGTPKGVAISHAAATQALLAHDRHIPPFSRFLQFAAPTFDVSIFEIFFPLFRGSVLVTVPRQVMLDRLPSVLRDMNIDACELTPTVAGSLLRTRQNAPKLKLLLTIGEMLTVPVVEEFGGSQGRESLLWAMYGPTEATIHCTLQTALSSESSTSDIGTPLDTVSCFVIEPSSSGNDGEIFKILPVGQIGELAVGGHQLARGYINRPEQTASAFIPSPYGPVYRTGDRARLTLAGKIQCLGRLAHGQVKLRGQRIELGEIEQVVLRTPGCHGAVATAVDSNLVVFCAVDEHVTEEEILTSCQSWLPQFMVPGELVMMKGLPQLPSGKVDVQKLKTDFSERKLAALDDEDDHVEEGGERGAEIIRVVSDTLGLRVNGRMTMASAGVDSLAAIRLASALRISGFETSAAELLDLRTISDLCCILSKRPTAKPTGRESLNISRLVDVDQILAQTPELKSMETQIEDIFPCISLQSAMLAATTRDPQVYCNEMELQAAPGLMLDEISGAIRRVVDANEILRTGFVHWHGIYLAVLFKPAGTDIIQPVDEFRHGFFLSTPRDFLTPLRIQIRNPQNGSAPRLLIQAHHAIYDGWSMEMMLSDISAFLARAPLPSRPQFRQVIQYHARGSKFEVGDLARKFWSEHLLGWNKTPFPKLAAQSSAATETKSARDTLGVPLETAREVARKSGCSVQVLFQASLALVWSGIIGESDVVLGSVTSGRTLPVDGIDRVLGPCIASLPLRVQFGSMVSNMDVLRSIHASNRAAMEHCLLPLSEMTKLAGLQPPESLYDVLFAYQESPDTQGNEGRKLLTQVCHLDRVETKLLLEIEPRNGDYAMQATYHSSAFLPSFIDHFMQQLKGVFREFLNHPQNPIQSTQRSIISGLSIDNQDIQPFHGIPDLAAEFEATAAKSPTAAALCFSTLSGAKDPQVTSLSYQQLNEAANRAAHYLGSCHVDIGEILAIVMNKSTLLYISILATVKAGCTYLPILPATPVTRMRAIFKQARIKYCLVDSNSLPMALQMDDVHFLKIDDDSLLSFSDKNPAIPPDPSRLAYAIYTSGTTGIPKGVAVTQGNIASNLAHLRSIYPSSLTTRPRFLQACSQAFDVSVFEIFFAWHAGMCLCIATSDDLFEDLEDSIRQFRITHLSLTPTVASLVDPSNVPEVEFLVTAGEPMTLPVLERWGSRLWQGYGPSETTNICSVKRMARGENIEHLGWVFPNTSVFVMWPCSLNVVPIGWVGEFCFGGDQVVQGYLNDPHLTAEKFVYHDQFGRLYRSGDMGRMLPDGSLVILGRLDDQIKLRGQRIEAGEINSVITSTGLAKAAATILAQRETGGPSVLASFYVPPSASPGLEPLAIEPEANRLLFARLRSRVPSYMVPSYLVPVYQIPVTPSGKVDRRLLEARFQELPRGYVVGAACTTQSLGDDAGWTESESTISNIIAKSVLVSRADIGRWTPFAALGIDSISAIQIARSLSSQLDVRISISAILENPSVAQLAQFLEANARTSTNTQSVNHLFNMLATTCYGDVCRVFGQDSNVVEEVLPCTPLQEAMLYQGSGSYWNKILLRLRIRADDMRLYWDEMSRRHGILRTCFVTTTNVANPIAQVVLRKWKVPWKTFDVHVPSLAGASHRQLECLPEAIDSGVPPLSCAFIQYKGSTFFSLICHHALYDGVAMENLWREVEALANSRILPPPVPYKPFIQQALSLPEDTDAFWAEQVRGFCPSTLFSRLATADINQCTHSTSFDLALGEIQERLRSLGASLISACQAAWALVLAVVCDCPDIAFGNVVSGRTLDLDGLDRLVAPCFNTIPIRKDLSRCSQNIEVVRSFQQLNAQMIRYQFTSVRQIQKVADGQRRGLFDTLLLLQQPLQEMDEKVWILEEDSGNMDIPLVCEVVPCPNLNSVVVNMHHDIGIISGYVATIMADMFKYIFRRLTDFPFASLPEKSSLPSNLTPGLEHLVPRREKSGLDQGGRRQLDKENWSHAEKNIREVISQLSGVPAKKIARHTSIFHLGLDSINAVQVASMLRQQGFKLSASDVVECPNCAKLATRTLHNAQDNPGATALGFDLGRFAREVSPQIRNKVPSCIRIEVVLPATSVQSAMMASFIQSQGRNYLNTLVYKIDDGVEMGHLMDAWNSLQRRHPMLRTGFVPVDHRDSPFAMVRQTATTISGPVECIDAQRCPPFDLRRWQEESRDSFLQYPHIPPWRVALVETGEGLLMFVLVHHAMYDAQSLSEILGSVSCLLQGGEPAGFTVEPALAEIMSRSLEAQTAAQEFWTRIADKAVVNKFPIMTPLRERKSSLLTQEIVSSMAFKALCKATRSVGASVQAVVQAAWARVMASYLGQSSVVFGVTMSGRTTATTQTAPFPCITTVPIVASNVVKFGADSKHDEIQH